MTDITEQWLDETERVARELVSCTARATRSNRAAEAVIALCAEVRRLRAENARIDTLANEVLALTDEIRRDREARRSSDLCGPTYGPGPFRPPERDYEPTEEAIEAARSLLDACDTPGDRLRREGCKVLPTADRNVALAWVRSGRCLVAALTDDGRGNCVARMPGWDTALMEGTRTECLEALAEAGVVPGLEQLHAGGWGFGPCGGVFDRVGRPTGLRADDVRKLWEGCE